MTGRRGVFPDEPRLSRCGGRNPRSPTPHCNWVNTPPGIGTPLVPNAKQSLHAFPPPRLPQAGNVSEGACSIAGVYAFLYFGTLREVNCFLGVSVRFINASAG